MTLTIQEIGAILYVVGVVEAGLWLVRGLQALLLINVATPAGCLFVFMALNQGYLFGELRPSRDTV